MDWLFSWGVTSAIAFFLVGLGFTVLGYRDFTFAKSCFVLAATDAIGSAVMWGIKNQGSLAVTALVVFLAAGTLAVLTLFAFKYADTKERTWTLAVEKPEAPAPPPEAYKHSPPPTPKEQKPLPPAPAHQEEQKPTPPPEQHLRVITEGIRSLRVDLRLTFTPKDGAKLPEGNDPFLFLSQDQSKIQGGAGEFLLNLENTRNFRIQEDNKVVVTYRYTVPVVSDLLGKPLKYLNLMDKMFLVIPTSLDGKWAKTLVYGEVAVYVNDDLWGLVPSAANREVTGKSTILTLTLGPFKRF